MSGGISAIKGFDYQATVILNRLFDHFDRHGSAARARPEGVDDLDLSWTVDGSEYRRYEQIKKPTEDRDGNLNPTPWTLPAAIDELLPNTIAHLSGNSDTQVVATVPLFTHHIDVANIQGGAGYAEALRPIIGMPGAALFAIGLIEAGAVGMLTATPMLFSGCHDFLGSNEFFRARDTRGPAYLTATAYRKPIRRDRRKKKFCAQSPV